MIANILSSRPLAYAAGGDTSEDRSAHVRAASGIARVGDRMVIVQDDTAFLAVIAGDAVDPIALPRGANGKRRFEERLGNKADKYDLESCTVIDGVVYAFGSGSTAKRERIVRWSGDQPELIDAAPMYAMVRAAVGGDINLEGAAWRADREELWLFHRGNCGPGDGPAIVRLDRSMARVLGTTRHDLGSIGDVKLGFTDATFANGKIYFLAAAEGSANAIDDGAILGARIGTLTDDGVIEMAELPEGLKAEGITVDGDRVWLVDDPDDPDRPSRLFEIELT